MTQRQYINHGLFGPFSQYKITESIIPLRPQDDKPTHVWAVYDAEKLDDASGTWGAQVFAITSEETPNGLEACHAWIRKH